MDVVDLYRLYILEEFLLDHEFKAFTVKNLVAFLWLIQSQTKLWSASPAAREKNPDLRREVLLLQVIFEHFHCFVSCLEHVHSFLQVFDTLLVRVRL